MKCCRRSRGSIRLRLRIANHFVAVVQAQRLGEGAARVVKLLEITLVDKETVVRASAIDVKATDLLQVVDPRGLRPTYRTGNSQHFKHTAVLVVNVGEIRRSVVGAHAVVASSLAKIVLTKQLVELRARIINLRVYIAVSETMGDAALIDVKTSRLVVVVDADHLRHHRAGEVFRREVVGQHEGESGVLI